MGNELSTVEDQDAMSPKSGSLFCGGEEGSLSLFYDKRSPVNLNRRVSSADREGAVAVAESVSHEYNREPGEPPFQRGEPVEAYATAEVDWRAAAERCSLEALAEAVAEAVEEEVVVREKEKEATAERPGRDPRRAPGRQCTPCEAWCPARAPSVFQARAQYPSSYMSGGGHGTSMGYTMPTPLSESDSSGEATLSTRLAATPVHEPSSSLSEYREEEEDASSRGPVVEDADATSEGELDDCTTSEDEPPAVPNESEDKGEVRVIELLHPLQSTLDDLATSLEATTTGFGETIEASTVNLRETYKEATENLEAHMPEPLRAQLAEIQATVDIHREYVHNVELRKEDLAHRAEELRSVVDATLAEARQTVEPRATAFGNTTAAVVAGDINRAKRLLDRTFERDYMSDFKPYIYEPPDEREADLPATPKLVLAPEFANQYSEHERARLDELLRHGHESRTGSLLMPENAPQRRRRLKSLRIALDAAGIDYSACIEKRDLEELCVQHNLAAGEVTPDHEEEMSLPSSTATCPVSLDDVGSETIAPPPSAYRPPIRFSQIEVPVLCRISQR